MEQEWDRDGRVEKVSKHEQGCAALAFEDVMYSLNYNESHMHVKNCIPPNDATKHIYQAEKYIHSMFPNSTDKLWGYTLHRKKSQYSTVKCEIIRFFVNLS